MLPTILWTLPFSESSVSMFKSFFQHTRDFYPFFFTIYQLAVFFGRSSITLFRLPGNNRRSSAAYWTLCGVEVVCFLTMLSQSTSMIIPKPTTSQIPSESIDPNANIQLSPGAVAAIMFVMGLCGGLGMGNTYWRVSKKSLPDSVWDALDVAKMRRMREAGRTFDTQEDGLLTADLNDGEENSEEYFSVRSRGRKTTASSSVVGTPEFCGIEEEEEMEEIRLGRRRNQSEETAVREFLVSTIALPDTMAILIASITGLWLQPRLCEWQVQGGRELCRQAGSL